MPDLDRFRGALLGLAVGDALGTTVEFKPRGTFEPLRDIVGGGPFDLKPGEWTDDTSMALCLASSLVERGRFDPVDQMQRYCRWHETGYLSSTGRCFDIGNTVSTALAKFKMSGDGFAGPTDPRSAGNGSIMRLAPVPMFFFHDYAGAVHHCGESSRTTHGATECVDACRLFGGMIHHALAGASKESVLLGEATTFHGAPKIETIARGEYQSRRMAEIRGTGYVVESLQAALWCFTHSETYEEAVILAANLGDDADTTAAVCGQLAGAFYGESAIPSRWLATLVMRDEIAALAKKLSMVRSAL
jgi:ADP-ribosyl-[dinitrogen reductase] hydrolase